MNITKEEALEELHSLTFNLDFEEGTSEDEADRVVEALNMAIQALEESNIEVKPSDCPLLEIVTCKDCKWWKDSDGVYRRGVGAESKCPINRKEVYEGDGYCFLFEPLEKWIKTNKAESEVEDGNDD